MSLWVRAEAGFALLSALACVMTGHSQSNGSAGIAPDLRQQYSMHQATDTLGPDDPGSAMAQRRLRTLNEERQKQMVADTNRLLKLARELNDEMASTTADALTADQLRKVAEIEKLARSVKERMVVGAGQTASQSQLPPPLVLYPSH